VAAPLLVGVLLLEVLDAVELPVVVALVTYSQMSKI
jgi:hypothetical protein